MVPEGFDVLYILSPADVAFGVSGMSKEEELAVANKLVAEWKQAVEGSLPAGSIVRLQLDKTLGDATERLAKVQQAFQLRTQIDGLPDGPIKVHMSKALAQLEAELGIAEGSGGMAVEGGGGGASSSWEVKVVVQRGGESQSLVLKDLHPDTTLGTLKASVEEMAQVPAADQQVCYSPSCQPLPGDDSCPLKVQSVRHRDTLIVKVRGAGVSGQGLANGDEVVKAVVGKAEKAKVKVKGPQDALALAVHVILMSEGFTPIAAEESDNGPRGFAPPVRPVPESRLVPSAWNADPTAVTLTYRHDKLRGRDIKVTCLWMDDAFMVELTDPKRTDGPLSITVQGSHFVDLSASGSDEPGRYYRDLTPLAQQVVQGVVDPLKPSKQQQPAPVPSALPSYRPPPTAPMEPGRPPFQGQSPFPGMPVPNPGLGPIPVPGMGGWGGRSGGLVPDFEGDLQPGGGFGPGGGNLMGPNHPIFSGHGPQGMYPGVGGGGGLGMPAPRFDPYGPVVGPTRGGPPARGPVNPNDPRGRGQAFREPDPDHLPPPGSNMYL